MFILILFGFGILLDILKHNVTDPELKVGTGVLFDLSVPMYFGFHACLHMLAEAYLAKIVNFQIRGTVFSLSSLISSILTSILGAIALFWYSGGPVYPIILLTAIFIPLFLIIFYLGVKMRLYG